jgi:hypothetical protein
MNFSERPQSHDRLHPARLAALGDRPSSTPLISSGQDDWQPHCPRDEIPHALHHASRTAARSNLAADEPPTDPWHRSADSARHG